MSGDSYKGYSGSTSRSLDYTSEDPSIRRRAEKDRALRIRDAGSRSKAEPARNIAKPMEKSVQPVERSLARNSITTPPKEAKEVHLFLVDNSGSNAKIAQALKEACGYIHANCSATAGNAAIAFQFFSDHCDNRRMIQETDYTLPSPEGEQILRASIANIDGADGGDAPEAIECALWTACDYDFAHIPPKNRALYLVTDQVAHGMRQMGRDDGCPLQRDWQDSIARVEKTFGRFQVIASGDNADVFEVQKKFIKPDRLRYDLLDLATGRLTHAERCRLVANALLFMVARNRGMQAVTAFLMLLLEKWLENPMYGSDTARRAKVQITEFAAYLEISDAERKELLDRIFAGLDDH